MSTKTILRIIAIGIILFGGMIALLQGTGAIEDNEMATVSNGNITITKNNIDVGEIPMSEGKIQIPFEFTNEGTQEVMLGAANTSCMCTEGYVVKKDGTQSGLIGMQSARNLNMSIAPGETAQLIAIYDPNAHGPEATGPVVRHIYINTNAASTQQLDFVFAGDVVK